ncbi:hypothetical protein EJ08DRAFT_734265 [Tothia fuscella]|uniref:Uncharacterized protein n=1 Tax=Tothia fuscella TaxID=1048955 RepID=A0A9P4NQJ2_9PEZI|nr:hypothetical protein EJ08DRAFT_734265 [Tothia fuscella]
MYGATIEYRNQPERDELKLQLRNVTVTEEDIQESEKKYRELREEVTMRNRAIDAFTRSIDLDDSLPPHLLDELNESKTALLTAERVNNDTFTGLSLKYQKATESLTQSENSKKELEREVATANRPRLINTARGCRWPERPSRSAASAPRQDSGPRKDKLESERTNGEEIAKLKSDLEMANCKHSIQAAELRTEKNNRKSEHDKTVKAEAKQKDALELEVSKLRKEVKTCEEKRASLETDHTSKEKEYEKEKSDLNTLLNQYKPAYASRGHRLQKLETDVATMKKSIEAYEAEAKIASSEISELTRAHDQSKRDREELVRVYDGNVGRLNECISELEETERKLCANTEASQKEIDLQTRLTEALADIETVKERNRKYRSGLLAERQTYDRYIDAINERHNQDIEDLTHDLEGIRQADILTAQGIPTARPAHLRYGAAFLAANNGDE